MPKNPHADFSPVLDGYSGIGAFRFWCQTALPLTYDDSLSYYELLNKVVNYLNHTIEDLTTVEKNTSALAEAYNQLQKYVNDYFDDLDVEAELRNVLDAMAEDGTLDTLLDPLVENQLPGVVDEKIDAVVAEQIDGAVAGQIDESVADQLPALVDAGIPEEVSDWLNENVDPVGSAVMVDSTLSISGAAADAKVTGDKLSELKTQLTDIEQSKIVSNLTGVTLLNDFDSDAIEVIKCIKYVEWKAVRAGTTLGELPIIRICICVNTEQYPRRIGIYTEENRGIQLTWDGNIGTGKVRENGNDNYFTIEFDWDNYSGSYNKTFENSKIEIRNSSYGAEIENNTNKIDNINVTLDNISDIGDYIAMKTISSRYIAYDGTITEWSNHDNSVIKYYPISAGETVVANGKSIKLVANYPIMIFAENITVGTVGKIIKYGSSELEDYNFIYTADKSGYVIIAYRTDTGFGELNLYKTFKSSDVLDIKKSAEYNNPMNNGTTYNSTYIDGNNRIIDGPQAFTLKKYPVTYGKLYRIVGEWVRLNYSSYPLACFSYTEFTGTTPFQCDLAIIPSGETATAKLYDIEFSPSESGYVYLVSYSAYPELSIYEGFNNENVSETINILTDTKRDFPVKMQLFGDSITDDSWRADGTWATVFEKYFPQRLWSISNDAVGGSHMGHGKVNSETGKYHDLEYNWVYDLITNESIFKPESDIILISDGTNDFNSSPLGQYNDTQPNTFYGALRSVCEYLSAHTKAKIFFCTPIARPTDADATKDVNSDGEKINAYGKTLRDYANAIKEVCAFYQFPVIDCFYEIGWNATNVKPYLDNVGVHPNEIGSNVIAQFIAGNIKKHFGM